MFSITQIRVLSATAIAFAGLATLATSYDVKCNVNLFGLSETQLNWKWNGFFVPSAKSASAEDKFTAAIGRLADVEWHGRWYPATIEATQDGLYYIHYVGYGCEWDEWVDSCRIRSIRTGVSKHYVSHPKSRPCATFHAQDDPSYWSRCNN